MSTKAGPGQYLSQNILPKCVPKKGIEGTSIFNGAKRDAGSKKDVTPGPQSYNTVKKSPKKESGNGKPFAVNEKRFQVVDEEFPGAGTYDHKDTIKVKREHQEHGTFKSGVERGGDWLRGQENPGTGEYEVYDHKTLAKKEFQGGAANNFILFTKQNYQVRDQPVKTKPRMEVKDNTPENVGPGSYINNDKKDFTSMFRPK